MSGLLLLRGCEVDLARREVRQRRTVTTLSEREAELLAYLAERPHQPVTRDQLLVEVWGFPEPVVTRAVDNTLMRLRSRVERDPKQPDHLVTVRGVGVCFVPLPAAPVPRPAGFLHGRAPILAALESALDASRLVTLHGPGGVGKTRLALEHVARHGGRVVPLGDAATRPRALALLADILGVMLPGSSPDAAAAQLARALARQPDLLVLDEVEHLLPELAADVGSWLAEAPGLTVLATSRRTLRLDAERLLLVPPLPPAAARALLDERSPVPLEPAAASALCERLEHLPLAIELVAPRLASQDAGAAELALHDVGGPDRPDRQRSLAAVLQRSWDLLTPAARDGLGALARAPGRWTDADARELLAPSVLDELVTSALLQRQGTTLTLSEPTRRFALERDTGGEAFAAWLLAACRRDADALLGDPAGLTRLAARLPAVEAALTAGIACAVDAAWAVAPALLERGPVDARWSEALARWDLPRAHLLRGALLAVEGRAEDAEQAFLRAEATGEASMAAEARARRGFLRAAGGDPEEGLALATEAAEAARDAGDARVEALARVRMGALLHLLARPLLARRALRRALDLHQQRGDIREEARTLGNLALFDIELGHHDRARPALHRALEHARHTGARLAELQITITLGGLAHLDGRLDDAEAHLLRALALGEEAGDVVSAALARWGLGALALERGDRDAARRDLGRAAAVFRGSASHFEALTMGWVALLDAADGDPGAAREQLADARALSPAAGPVLDVLGGLEADDDALRALDDAPSSSVRQALRVVRALRKRR